MERAWAKQVEYGIEVAAMVDIDDTVDLFNDAYSEYYVDTKVDADRISALVEREDISVANSFVAFDGDRPIGIVFLGVRGQRGYICGMGIRVAYQGRGIGELLMRRVVREAADMGLATLQLEVVDRNFRARSLYEKLGFVPLRTLGIWNREGVHVDRLAQVNAPIIELRAVRGADVLRLIPLFNEIRPCWQNEVIALGRHAARFAGYLAYSDSAPVGYALFADSTGGLYLADFAASAELGAEQRAGVGRILIGAIDMEIPRPKARVFNLPRGGYQEQALVASGFNLTLSQQEMVLCLR